MGDQLEFVAYEFCNTYEAMGTALKQATKAEEAKKSVNPGNGTTCIDKRYMERHFK